MTNWIPLQYAGVAADAILALHVAVVIFVIMGQLAVLIGWWRGWLWVRNLWFRLAHLVTIAIVVMQAWLGRLCPLTIWEQDLRARAGQASFEESFIEHWLGKLIYFDLPWWVFVLAYTLFAGLVLISWWGYPPRRSANH